MNRRNFFATLARASAAMACSSLSEAADSRLRPAAKISPIRIGQIGTAHAHAAGKMGAMRNLPDLYEVVGVVEPDPLRRAAAQQNKIYQGLNWMTEEQLLNTSGLQAVAVETEVSDLLATAGRAIAAGMHIHLDKPAGESLSSFKKIVEDARRRKLTVQMGYMFRYNSGFQLCYQAVREGWLGEIFSVDAVMGKVLDIESRKALLKYRGGAMFELGCHVIDSVVKILGKPQRVTAHNRSSPAYRDGFADNQLALLEYPKATATVRSSIIEVEGTARRQFVVCGDQGTLEIRPLEPPQARLALDRPRGSYKQGYQNVPMPRLPRYDGEFIDLAKVIRGEKEFEWPPEHDLAVQEIILLASGLPLKPQSARQRDQLRRERLRRGSPGT